jgi:rhodanese-related sulfurtransferase
MTDLPLEISCRETQRLLEENPSALLLDCREQQEYDLVKISAAKLIPMSEFPVRVSELEPHRASPIIIHCHHGGRSAQVAMWLRGQGFNTAQSMAGGIDEWATEIESGLPRY